MSLDDENKMVQNKGYYKFNKYLYIDCRKNNNIILRI